MICYNQENNIIIIVAVYYAVRILKYHVRDIKGKLFFLTNNHKIN